MPETKFNPSQQVERIREILVGREMGRIERRLAELETTTTATTSFRREPEVDQRMATTQQSILRETQDLKMRIQKESAARQHQIAQLAKKMSQGTTAGTPMGLAEQGSIERHVSDRMEKVAAEMTSLIDARTREILHHLQNEILQWKNQMDRDLQSIRDIKADKKELTSRFARLASAAMDDQNNFETPEGYLL
jgi:hypothetical protein